jgi:hypothetical protein
VRIIDEFPPYTVKRCNYTPILDGRIHELEYGSDFTCDPSSFASSVRQAAHRRGIPVDVRRYVRREDGRRVVAVRALPA